jgi:hypothetical protein
LSLFIFCSSCWTFVPMFQFETMISCANLAYPMMELQHYTRNGKLMGLTLFIASTSLLNSCLQVTFPCNHLFAHNSIQISLLLLHLFPYWKQPPSSLHYNVDEVQVSIAILKL